jgi:hypothetical protein
MQLSEIATDSWLEPPLQPTAGLIAVYNGPIQGIHRSGEEPIGSLKQRINPVMAPVKKNVFSRRKNNDANQSSSSSSSSSSSKSSSSSSSSK